MLIQHNIVRPVLLGPAAKVVAPQPRRAARGVGRFVYEASLDEVLARRWYWWVVGKAERRFGQDGALLMEHMLAVGRYTLDDLAHGAALAACKGCDGPAVAQRAEELDGVLQQLREARYFDPVDELPTDDVTPILPMALVAPAGLGGKGRRGRGAGVASPAPAAGKRKRGGALTAASTSEFDARVAVAPPVGNPGEGKYRRLWRANLAEARRAFRWEAISTLVTDKHDETAGMVRLLFWIFLFALFLSLRCWCTLVTNEVNETAGLFSFCRLASSAPAAPHLTRPQAPWRGHLHAPQ